MESYYTFTFKNKNILWFIRTKVDTQLSCTIDYYCAPPVLYAVTNAYQLEYSLYTMGCPPVLEDNPQALRSGLSCVLADKPMV